MRKYRGIPIVTAFASIFAFAVASPSVCTAQETPDPPAENRTDAEGCTDLAAFPKLPTSIILSCRSSESAEMAFPLKPDDQGRARDKVVHGAFEYRDYQIEDASQQEQAYANLLQLLPMSGFTIKYADSPTKITARSENAWILVSVSGELYSVALLQPAQEAWAQATNEKEIAEQIAAHSRVAIYGVQFSPDNKHILRQNSAILEEVFKYLKDNPSVSVIVESHKMSASGNAHDDEEITKQRASTVVSWLQNSGIEAARLRPEGLGRSKALNENDTTTEIEQNERIELVKAGS
jgi:outer membrane protein OmpA-like peptidoglycan-associated protein